MKKIYFLLIALCVFTIVNAQIINIPDANFKAKLLASDSSNFIAKDLGGDYFKIDSNYDGEIDYIEAFLVSDLQINYSTISNLSGIEYFVNLGHLECNNNLLTSLNLSSNTALTYLYCPYNQLTNLEVSSNTALTYLYCATNLLTSLDISSNINLEYFSCFDNQLTTIDVSGLTNLITFECGMNTISTLNVSSLVNLEELGFYALPIANLDISNLHNLLRFYGGENQLTNIDFSNSTLIENLNCPNNELTSLDVSMLPNLKDLRCSNNILNNLNIKNGVNELLLNFNNNPSLNYICADENQLASVQAKINTYGYSATCSVSSYCSFAPGGTFYTIQGNNKFDSNNNGYDNSDIKVPNLKFVITDGTTTGTVVPDFFGSYSIPVQAGTHTITPNLDNPSYFIISPTSATASFPTQANPFTQNFCVTANGTHSDVEVFITPIDRARPGFDTKYSIVFQNKGNQVESGTVNFNFDDTKLDFVSADVAPTQSTGNLTWNYTNLKSFEAKSFEVKLNINSPLETPAVNDGDVLNYTANITSGNTDELPGDNTFTLNQTAVNSFDPNDITCLEGASVSTAKIGDYVHYMIRFENNGSAEAVNIVVKNVVDTTKFDINTLIPYDANYDYYTRINGNKVEFIFENIYLPFDDANNDGYLAFKIKLKSNLVAGDTFSKNANIYFDYNFPIVTNTATTTIAALSVQDFVFSNYFSVYPNPVHNVLNIATKESIEVSSINIYNTLGQLVLVIPNAQSTKTVDVSILTTGNYFIKINSDKGTSNTKFVKN